MSRRKVESRRRLRDRATDKAAIAVVLKELAYELKMRAPGLVVIERNVEKCRAQITDVLAGHLECQAREAGFRVVTLSLTEACARIVSDGSARAAARVLLRRYDILAQRLAPNGVPLLHHERWREEKQLVTAFALAHAVGLDVLTSLAHPLGLGPPAEL
jgi:hypothetical protein